MSGPVAMTLWLGGTLAGLGLSALYSGLETGLYTINRIRLRLRSESGEPAAVILQALLRDRPSLLGTLLIGNNIANYVGTSCVVGLFSTLPYGRLADWQISILVPVIFTPLLLIFGEIVPKNIFRYYTDRYSYRFARALKWSRRLFRWCGLLVLVEQLTALLIWAAGRRGAAAEVNPFHPRRQLGLLIRESSHQGALTPYQSILVDRVMNLRNVTVASAMVPLARVQAVPRTITRDELIERLRGQGGKPIHVSRVPVYDEQAGPTRILGLINTNEVVGSTDRVSSLDAFIYGTVRLRPDATVTHALFALQRARRAMGIVATGAGDAVGVVTIKDLVEEITGEIEEW